MREHDFMKRVAEQEMPDIDYVKEECLRKLQNSKTHFSFYYVGGVIAVAIFLFCLCLTPARSFAKDILVQIKTVLHINEKTVQLGNTHEIKMKIPKDCEKVKIDRVTYLTKGYKRIGNLKKETGVNFYTWNRGTPEKNGIMLNVLENNYGRITIIYDVMQGKVADKDTDLKSVDLFVYVPLSDKTKFGDFLFENEQMKYATVDEQGNITKYKQNTKYELVKKYHSKTLDTEVSVIASKTETKTGKNYSMQENTDIYYLYFVLDGICYQIDCVGTLEASQDVVEHMALEDICPSALVSIR